MPSAPEQPPVQWWKRPIGSLTAFGLGAAIGAAAGAILALFVDHRDVAMIATVTVVFSVIAALTMSAFVVLSHPVYGTRLEKFSFYVALLLGALLHFFHVWPQPVPNNFPGVTFELGLLMAFTVIVIGGLWGLAAGIAGLRGSANNSSN